MTPANNLRDATERIINSADNYARTIDIDKFRYELESVLREVVDANEVKWHTYYQHKLAENKFNEKQMDYAVNKARAEAIEDCAKIAEQHYGGYSETTREIASMIRALKS